VPQWEACSDTTTPSLIVVTTLSRARTSASGSPSMMTMSASFPASMVPSSLALRTEAAAFLVRIVTMSCGEKTRASARSSSDSVSLGGQVVSVPKPYDRPASQS